MKKTLENSVKIIIILFICFVFIWMFYVTITYTPYIKALNETGVIKSVREDGYTYGVVKPSFLSFTGNLYISQDSVFHMDEGTAEDCIGILIWPRLLKEDEIEYICSLAREKWGFFEEK
ncbi:MAG: hypothetical protein Q4B70_06660 [Lachnospiraceae bacterium]|nr:hypothetical protein [Lachnospiraceae bacterium]